MLIISDSNDKSTDQVIDWLDFFDPNIQFKRTNVDYDFEKIVINIGEKESNKIDNLKVVWIRRGHIPIIPNSLKNTRWTEYLKKEQLSLLTMFELSEDLYCIGSFHKELYNNKLYNLKEASKVGLSIPQTIITNNREDLLSFIDKDKKYITKSLCQSPYIEFENYYYYGNGTISVNLDNIPPIFAPSLIQECIEKEVEIRVFFIEEKIFSMAIFSQNDESTQLDFRNYNKEKPNRLVPFDLPSSVSEKISLFIKNNEYTTGSIDLILTPENNFIFLEINPMGQYDWLSYNCNYYIDEEIAKTLIRYENKNS